MKNKTPWLRNDGKFECRTCKAVEAYILHKTKLECQVHKTDRYLVVNYLQNGVMKTSKITMTAGVLYCVNEEDFSEFLKEIEQKQEKKEYILCAAIHYPVDRFSLDEIAQPERHRPKNITEGYVMCGRRHHNIISLHRLLTGDKTVGEAEQGFLTNTDRFVNRVEALKIAIAADQILDYKQIRGYGLFSEDLY